MAKHETGYITVLFGAREGFSEERQRRIPVETDPHPHEVRTPDVDDDGHADLLVDDRSAGLLRAFRGRGGGSFVTAEPVDVGGDPYLRVAVADLDGHGRVDLVTPNPRTVAVHFGDGRGGFGPGPRLRAPGLRPFSAAAGDVNGDGVPDLLAGNSQEGGGEGRFVVWLGSDTERWTPGERRSYLVGGGPSEVALTDVDGDGRAEIVTADNGGDEISVFFHRGG